MHTFTSTAPSLRRQRSAASGLTDHMRRNFFADENIDNQSIVAPAGFSEEIQSIGHHGTERWRATESDVGPREKTGRYRLRKRGVLPERAWLRSAASAADEKDAFPWILQSQTVKRVNMRIRLIPSPSDELWSPPFCSSGQRSFPFAVTGRISPKRERNVLFGNASCIFSGLLVPSTSTVTGDLDREITNLTLRSIPRNLWTDLLQEVL